MEAQVINSKNQEKETERRIVYLKDHADTQSKDACPVVTCPGHCACASK